MISYLKININNKINIKFKIKFKIKNKDFFKIDLSIIFYLIIRILWSINL